MKNNLPEKCYVVYLNKLFMIVNGLKGMVLCSKQPNPNVVHAAADKLNNEMGISTEIVKRMRTLAIIGWF